jgi:hypothetical protein
VNLLAQQGIWLQHSMFAFKKFSFFQQVEVKLHGLPPNSTCHCVGPQQLFIGCDNGSIHVLDETYQSQGSFNGFGHKVLFMAFAQVRTAAAGSQPHC